MKKLLVIILFFSFVLFSACQKNSKYKLLILHAGSLSIPFQKLAVAFMEANPDIEILTEAAGSRTCARKITELGSRADVMASADSEVIRTLLMPKYANFCIDFARNEMVLMFNEKSRFASSINPDNWYLVLQEEEVIFSHSDPNSDPCGYRALLVMQLAEKFYDVPELYQNLLSKRSLRHIRPKETDLLALLETGELDYVFIYKSVAEQHKGLYLAFPDEINLKSSVLAEVYAQASVELSGTTPEERVTRAGAPIIYGMTIPTTALFPHLGARFIGFVLGPEGRAILEKSGQDPIYPPHVDNIEMLPHSLSSFFQDE